MADGAECLNLDFIYQSFGETTELFLASSQGQYSRTRNEKSIKGAIK